jgi:phospholipase D1/2
MHWQYVSICRGGRSILEELQKAGIDGQRYISFFALRSYDRINKEHIQDMLANSAGYSTEEVQAAGASQRPEERRAQFIKAGEPDFVRGTAGSVAYQHPLENIRDKLENAVEYTRVPDEEEGQKVLNDAIKMAKHNEARDSVGRDAMLDGDLDKENWVDDTRTDRPRGKAAEADEAEDYVTEELYIHAKLMIVDGKCRYFEPISNGREVLQVSR